MDGVTVTAIARTFAVTIVTSPATGERSNMIAGSCVAICVVATMLRLRVSERKCAPAIVTWIATTVMSTATSGTCTGIVTGTVAKIESFNQGKEGKRAADAALLCFTVQALSRSAYRPLPLAFLGSREMTELEAISAFIQRSTSFCRQAWPQRCLAVASCANMFSQG